MSEAHNTLGIAESATFDEIKAAYKKLAMQHHPDRGGDPEKFQTIAKAYKRLTATKCSVCNGTGFVTNRTGAFVTRTPCPVCWKK